MHTHILMNVAPCKCLAIKGVANFFHNFPPHIQETLPLPRNTCVWPEIKATNYVLVVGLYV